MSATLVKAWIVKRGGKVRLPAQRTLVESSPGLQVWQTPGNKFYRVESTAAGIRVSVLQDNGCCGG